ncbi:hypothetical protein C8F01DRAFT_1109921 [Mycena amicta]|nr:hypothetical protein C8F01DRAFT_1109921 [Mycena amicta]
MEQATWPPEPLPPVGYLSRRALPIKRLDAEPLTREDVQYDLLYHIFHDDRAVFHSPTAQGKLVPFRQLYIDALYNSNKCSKVIKDKMVDCPEFGVELGKISLLTNVGRINTTMAFFPEMKTALRTYHPVPSLQKTDGNAQDAPRIKNCLKAALLASEFKSVPPSTPDEIVAKRQSGLCPATSVVNLIFVLSNHAAPFATRHFDGTINFLDLFLPKPLFSPDRARVFLWLMYHYLEDSEGPNPFDDAFSAANKGKAPLIKRLTKEEEAQENVDSPEEKEHGKKMSNQRNAFLQRLITGAVEEHRKSKEALPQFVTAIPPEPRQSSWQHAELTKKDPSFMFYVPDRERELQKHVGRMRGPEYHKICRHTPPPGPDRSMLDQAWHIIMNHDPLRDSDDESQDEGFSIEYNRRLDTLKQLRGRSLTPELMDDEPRFRRDIEWD